MDFAFHQYEIFPYRCPVCFWLPDKGGLKECERCNFTFPRTYCIPFGESWYFDETLSSLLREVKGWYLVGNYIGKKPNEIESFTHVEFLKLGKYPRFSFEFLKNFKRLYEIELYETNIKTVQFIDQIQSLKILKLGDCKGLVTLDGIQGLKELKCLKIHACTKVTDFSPVSNLKELLSIGIISTKKLEADFIQDLKELQEISLFYKEGPLLNASFFLPFSKLKRLILSKKFVEKNFEKQLKEKNPDIEIFIL